MQKKCIENIDYFRLIHYRKNKVYVKFAKRLILFSQNFFAFLIRKIILLQNQVF